MGSTDKGLLTPQNYAVVLMDYQDQLLPAISGQERKDLLDNVLVLARAASRWKYKHRFAVLADLSTVQAPPHSWPPMSRPGSGGRQLRFPEVIPREPGAARFI